MSAEQFFKLTSHLVNDNQQNDIMNLFKNLQNFNYNDIFGDDDFSIQRPRPINAINMFTLRKPKSCTIVKGYVNRDKFEHFYKVWVFQDDKYKNWFILMVLKEIYFQKLYYNYLINNNIKDFAIPIIYRYGLIPNSTEITFFVEMKRYQIAPIPTFIIDENTNQIQELIDYVTGARDIVTTISNLNTGIYHNDSKSPDSLNKCLTDLEEIKARIENFGVGSFNLHDTGTSYYMAREVGDNICKLTDGTFLLCDFEHSSTIYNCNQVKGKGFSIRNNHKIFHLIMENINSDNAELI